MTGYTVHTGSTEKFSDGWDRIFSGTKKAAGKSKKNKKSKGTSGDKSKGEVNKI